VLARKDLPKSQIATQSATSSWVIGPYYRSRCWISVKSSFPMDALHPGVRCVYTNLGVLAPAAANCDIVTGADCTQPNPSRPSCICTQEIIDHLANAYVYLLRRSSLLLQPSSIPGFTCLTIRVFRLGAIKMRCGVTLARASEGNHLQLYTDTCRIMSLQRRRGT
jgi:hypothetical protein